MKLSKPRILFIATFPPPVHGSSMVSQQIKESKLINDSFNCDYVNLSTSRTMEEIGKSGFWLYVKKLFRFLESFTSTFWHLLTNRYALCYLAITCHGVGFLKDAPFILLCKLFGCKVIIHQHNKGMSADVDRPVYRRLFPFVYRNTKVILLSWYLYPDIEKVVKKEQVLICPNGSPMPEYLKLRAESLELREEENSLSSKVPEILFLSNLMESKGVWILLDALKILKEKGVKFHCSFVGNTSRFISAEKFAREERARGLDSMVEYLGPQYGDDKWRAYERADVFVLPSMDDCLPLTIMEAMMSGVPVVGSDVGAIPDLVTDQETGFVISHEDLVVETGGKFLDWTPNADMAARIAEAKSLKLRDESLEKGSKALADRLERLLTNPELRKQMGKAGYEKYQREFTLEAFEKNICRCMKECLA